MIGNILDVWPELLLGKNNPSCASLVGMTLVCYIWVPLSLYLFPLLVLILNLVY